MTNAANIFPLSNDTIDVLIIGQTFCTQGSIRLQGGTNNSGVVEVCHINVWGTVCGYSGWGLANAQVACRQLGLPSTGATTISLSTFPNGNQVSWLEYVRCTGIESSLFNCISDLTGNNYCYQSDTGVSCQHSKSNLAFFILYIYVMSIKYLVDKISKKS